jgi:hypothetical protein
LKLPDNQRRVLQSLKWHWYRTAGGDGTGGSQKSDEQREQMRERSKMKWREPEYRSAVMAGLERSTEMMRAHALVRWQDPQYRDAWKAGMQSKRAREASENLKKFHPMKDPRAREAHAQAMRRRSSRARAGLRKRIATELYDLLNLRY